MRIKTGIPSRAAYLPLYNRLAEIRSFEIHTGTMGDLARELRRHEIDAAVVSPLEYARESSEYLILPGFALSSRTGISLYFHEGLRKITSMAAHPGDISEIVLARIVLSEEFETTPPIVPCAGNNLGEMLKKADAALLNWDALPFQETTEYHSLDVAEAWGEIVNLPFVHGILCAREGAVSPEAVRELEAVDWSNLPRELPWAEMQGGPEGEAFVARTTQYLSQHSFALTDQAEEGLIEFLRYAHYYGIIPDVPLFRLYPSGPGADEEN